jgi:nucleotide-binding universal stress UspA family protein
MPAVCVFVSPKFESARTIKSPHIARVEIVDGPEIAWVGDKTNTPYHQAARRLQEAVSGEVHLWSNVKHAVQYGQPYGEILAYAETNEIDLIAVGAHGTGFGHTHFVRIERR